MNQDTKEVLWRVLTNKRLLFAFGWLATGLLVHHYAYKTLIKQTVLILFPVSIIFGNGVIVWLDTLLNFGIGLGLILGGPIWVLVGLALPFVTVIVTAFLPILIAAGILFIPMFACIGMPLWITERVIDVMGRSDKLRESFYLISGWLRLRGNAARTIEGEARLMGTTEVTKLQRTNATDKGARVALGKVGLTPFSIATDKHVLIVAGSRSGKGRDLIIPNLKTYKGAVLVLDPKGENCQITRAAREQFGSVHALDPFEVSGLKTSRFNPLATLKGPSLVTDAAVLADALVIGDHTDHWAQSARFLLSGLILTVVTAKLHEGAGRDLVTMRHWLTRNLPETIAFMCNSRHAGGTVAAVGNWAKQMAEKEWASIVSTAIEQTRFLDDPFIQEVLKDGGEQVDFTQWRTHTQSVFVCLPAPQFKTFSRWLRLIVASALDPLICKKPEVEPTYPVLFILDELAQLGYMEKVETAVTLSAGYGVQVWGVFQNVDQINRCYPSSGVASFVGSSGITCVFGVADNETADYFSKATDCLTTSAVRRMGDKDMLVLLSGQNPLLVQRVPYYET